MSQLPVVNSDKDKEELNTCEQADSEKQILSKPEFFETIGKNLRKYWKIGIHWLTVLKSVLAEPFDRRAVEILNST